MPASQLPLPESARLIEELVGRDATLRLASLAKHRKFYVPHNIPDDHWIVMAIGREATTKLQKMLAGSNLDLAKCHRVFVFERNTRMRKDHREGATVLDLMRDNNMSKRAVRYIIAGWNGRPTKPTGPRKAHGRRRQGHPSTATHPPGLGPSKASPSGGQ